MDQRRILDSDRDLLNQWISQDPHHRDTTTADFFFEPETITLVYSDGQGPVFFMRCQAMFDDDRKVIRLDIQFDNDQRVRNGKMLIRVNEQMCPLWKAKGFSEIFFTSESPLLKAFCKRALGFDEIDGALRKSL